MPFANLLNRSLGRGPNGGLGLGQRRVRTSKRSRVLLASLMVLAASLFSSGAQALGQTIPGDFQLSLSSAEFGVFNLTPEFSTVRNFRFELDFRGPLTTGEAYGNEDLLDARYLVRGALNTNPPTPSGFPGFLLDRFENGEGTITPQEWASQGSLVGFRISRNADLRDGVQLDELESDPKSGQILEIYAVEFGRLDRARYHPPQLVLFDDGTGFLRNANNDSKDTGTVNPATNEEVHVDFGDEYITRIGFDPKSITVIRTRVTPPIPEPTTALLLGLGLAGLAARGRA